MENILDMQIKISRYYYWNGITLVVGINNNYRECVLNKFNESKNIFIEIFWNI